MDKKNEPLDIQAMYEKALSSHQQGDIDEAIRLYRQLAEHFPKTAGIHYNIGLALFEREQFDEAVTAYTRAAELSPDDSDIFYNLGLACKKAGKYNASEQAYLRALDLQPGDKDILYNLGCCYLDSGATEPARTTFEKLVALAPDHVPALNNLAYTTHLLGDFDLAKILYGRVVELDPERQSARYMHAVLSGSSENRPPQEYIRELFDKFSESYDTHLVENLECALFHTMRKILDGSASVKTFYHHCLDLGCGTGLSGAAFRSACGYLTGIDLSEKMIEQARLKNIYDKLICSDIIEYIHNAPDKFNLIIAADVLPYLGELSPLLDAAALKCSDDGIFCFSTETTSQPDWLLQSSGRYAHHPRYVRDVAQQAGWTILHESSTDIRKEKDRWIKGSIFVLGRQR